MLPEESPFDERRHPSTEDIVRQTICILRESTPTLSDAEVAFIRAFIKEVERKAERWQRIQETIFGTVTIAFVLGIGAGVLKILHYWIKQGAPNV